MRCKVIKNLNDLKEAESTVGKGSGMFVRYVPLSTHHMTTPDRPASQNDQNWPSLWALLLFAGLRRFSQGHGMGNTCTATRTQDNTTALSWWRWRPRALIYFTCVPHASTNTTTIGTEFRSLSQGYWLGDKYGNAGRGINAQTGVQELNWICTGLVRTKYPPRHLDNVRQLVIQPSQFQLPRRFPWVMWFRRFVRLHNSQKLNK